MLPRNELREEALGIAVASALLIALVTGAYRSVGHIEQMDKTEKADEKSSSDKSDQKDGSGQAGEKPSKRASKKKTN